MKWMSLPFNCNLFKTLMTLVLLFIGFDSSNAQKIEVYNESGKMIYSYREGRNLDFRIDHKKLYPDSDGSILESRMYSTIDSISGNTLFLTDNMLVADYSKTETILRETEYEFTELSIDIGDIKAVSFTPLSAAIGNSLFSIGLATVLASPLLGLTPDGFSTSRFATVAGIGLATAGTGAIFKFGFRQKPVKIKEFDGPEYFKKYQSGSLSKTE